MKTNTSQHDFQKESVDHKLNKVELLGCYEDGCIYVVKWVYYTVKLHISLVRLIMDLFVKEVITVKYIIHEVFIDHNLNLTLKQ